MRFIPRYTLKDLHEFNRLSFEQVAEHTGIAKKRIEFLENDSSEIVASEMLAFSRLYKLSIDYIFLGTQQDFDNKLSDYLRGRA